MRKTKIEPIGKRRYIHIKRHILVSHSPNLLHNTPAEIRRKTCVCIGFYSKIPKRQGLKTKPDDIMSTYLKSRNPAALGFVLTKLVKTSFGVGGIFLTWNN